VPNEAILVLLAGGIPVCLARLWLIWWRSKCVECGLEHSACVCPAGDHLMRPRR